MSILCRAPEECPQAVADLVAACLDLVPSKRPSAKDIVQTLVLAERPAAAAAGRLSAPVRSRRTQSQPLPAAALAEVRAAVASGAVTSGAVASGGASP